MMDNAALTPTWRRWWMVAIYICAFLVLAGIIVSLAGIGPLAKTECPSDEENSYFVRMSVIMVSLNDQLADLERFTQRTLTSPAALDDPTWKAEFDRRIGLIGKRAGEIGKVVAPDSVEDIHADVLLFAAELHLYLDKYQAGVHQHEPELVEQSIEHFNAAQGIATSIGQETLNFCG